ncbi:hypothetical protein [Streptomyces collinus]|uniref:Uncharacterized protein n=1 Tax=Streptomyces collinus (strain DSM 40733 / Tue 365) TaxID=1214242 RepID=S5VS43_STRC3|nr:hypothetical protein [Streptomyces collinus]AGS73657.1 hypothetical protein B446_34295 [Streptomyces collinus Tu 365]
MIPTSPPPAAAPSTAPTVAALRRVVDELAASTHTIGELMLGVAPVYLSDADAADAVTLLCEAIGEHLEHGLAATPSPAAAAPCTAPSSDRRRSRTLGLWFR